MSESILPAPAGADPTALPEPRTLVEERRVHPRVELQAEVDVRSEDNLVTGFTEDISRGGAFVATEAPPPVGDVVHLSLLVHPARGEELHLVVEAEVCWHRTGDDGSPTGCGLRFVDLTAGQRERLETLLQRLPQPALLDDLDDDPDAAGGR